MEKKYYITTYGCQMNLHESEKIAGILTGMGYTEAEDEKTADIIVFNTCCIRENAEDRAYGNIGALKKLKRENPSLLIAVGGCMTQQPDAADAEQDLLLEPVLPVAAVKLVSDGTVELAVHFIICIQQIQRNTTYIDFPHISMNEIVQIRNIDNHRLSVFIQHTFDR